MSPSGSKPHHVPPSIALVYGTYFIAAASPGPSNMAIMGTAMRDGRRPALALAAGVVTGSLFWAIVAASGVLTLLTAYAQALVIRKIAGGLYLLYLALRAGKSAMRETSEMQGEGVACETPRHQSLYRQGFLMHIGNPKAVMSWVAIIALGARQDDSAEVLMAIVGDVCSLVSWYSVAMPSFFQLPP